jgi:hypothetical protein
MKLVLCAVVPLVVQAQLVMPITSLDADARRPGTVTFTGASSLPADQGAPFSGEEKVAVAVGGNASILTAAATNTKVWRDAQGRTRMEDPNSPLVQICDPVEGACYVLDAHEMVAHRMKYMPGEVTTVNPADSREEKQKLERLGIAGESFGRQTIQGVTAKGYRFKVALIHEAKEVWFAPALGIAIRSVSTEGPVETTTEIVNLSLENPALELFKMPAGYRVRNETGPFTIALRPGTRR